MTVQVTQSISTIGSFIALLASMHATHADTVIGQAYSQDDFRAVYREVHQRSPEQHNVVYHNDQNTVFANKTIDYSKTQSAPDISFRSSHCDETYTVTKSSVADQKIDQNFALEVAIHYSNSCARKKHNQSITLTPPYVIDAGFDHHLRGKLVAVKNQDIRFNYPLPSRFKEISLQAKALNCSDISKNFADLLEAQNATIAAQKNWHQCIILRPSNWLIAKLFPPIYLAYDQRQELAMYAGKSNISNAKGDYEKVLILYSTDHQQQKISLQ
jgi:hypothetical protein